MAQHKVTGVQKPFASTPTPVNPDLWWPYCQRPSPGTARAHGFSAPELSIMISLSRVSYHSAKNQAHILLDYAKDMMYLFNLHYNYEGIQERKS